ncbi:MAG: GH3 auxin-responsive promoter family protein [Chloroflexi bacterium]|nr:GH3 auxin-responsive promoter family protein [Chloroflexota bacterium]
MLDDLLRVVSNGLWCLLCLPEALAFRRALGDVAGTQWALLRGLLARHAETEFGRRYGFATIRSAAEYQARVPLSTYDDYRDAVQQIAAGQRRVLTMDPVVLLEPTSGSTAPTKHLPYTAALKTEFRRAVAPWLADLYRHVPGLLRGQAYWSVTPVARRNERTPGGIPIGFEEDSEYFGGLERVLVHRIQAVPPAVRLIAEVEAFRYTTLLFLLRSRRLALISVWNPTFLTLLVGRLPVWWPRLADDIAAGTITPPGPLPPDVAQQLMAALRPDSRRAAEVRAALQASDGPAEVHARLWPYLRLISCWSDGNAALPAADLARLFPQARLQGKGLLATEGVVSFPLVGQPGGVLALRSHFFEFLPSDDPPGQVASVPLLAHELQTGCRYAVVMTTGGGLYRYQLHDRIEVVGHFGACPLVRFVGKEAHVSDRFGEKVNAGHVEAALTALLARYGLQPALAMVACDEAEGTHAYTLFIEEQQHPDAVLRQLGADLEAALQENYHYRYCRDLGQLGPLRVFRIAEQGLETYFATCQAQGQRLGDIKPVMLHHAGGWSRAFHGSLLPPAGPGGEPRATPSAGSGDVFGMGNR